MAFKIKSRKEREKEYKERYSNISRDGMNRLSDYLGDSLTPKFVKDVLSREKEINDKMTYSRMDITLYEEPVQAHRPRSRGRSGFHYVPNASDNWKAFGLLIENIQKSLKVITTPTKFICHAYYPIPSGISKIDVVLYEKKILRPIAMPDFDNVLKSYCDSLQKWVFLNDDIICSSEFEKYASLLPRVEICIIYQDSHACKKTYKKIKSRKTFEELKDRIDIKLI